MPKGKRAALFCCALCVAIAALWPGLWNQPLQHQQINQWIRGKRLSYQGTLQVWYLPAGASGTGDGSAWVQARMKKFEKNNFGIFFEMQVLDQAQLQQKLTQGERPDLVFFGKQHSADVMPLLQKTVQSAPLAPAMAEKQEEGLIWPVFYGGYALLVNEQALYTAGLSPPLDKEDMDQAYLDEVKQALPHAFACETPQAGLAAMTAPVNQATKQAFADATPGTREQFIKEEIAFFVCPASTWYTLEGMSNTQSIPSYQATPLANLAIDVQCVGIGKTDDADKSKACDAAVAFLLNQYSQQALENIGALPVTDSDGLQAQGAITGALWQQREPKTLRWLPMTEQAETFFTLAQTKGLEAAEQWLESACNER